MRTRTRSLLSLATAALLAACGGTPSDADDPGSGTRTLRVEASITATPDVSNAQTSADFTTEFSIRIDKAGTPITSGTVTVTGNAGPIALTWSDPNGGRWRGSAPSYDQVYQLDVVAGADTVEGVVLAGPDVHVFTAPTPGATVDATLPLDVAWASQDVATSTSIKTREIDPIGIDDTGSYQLAVGTLRSKPTEVEQEELRLTRSTRIEPAGAVAGSQLTVSIDNRIDLVVAPTGP
ncbi:MAG: hypothetical protein H6708_24190 [Kofleriaceae bacterium]|nr:hypothetical protein [Kofleriaceae bacterium]